MKKIMMLGALLLTPWAYAQSAPHDVTVMTLSATARQTVTPDTLHATLQIMHKAEKPEDVQRVINAHMKKALDAVKDVKDVKFITGHYNVHERWVSVNEKNKERERIWQGSQTVTLEGMDQTAVLKLAGQLQEDGFAMQNLSYSLSRAVRDSFEEALMAEALGTIQQRAERFGKQLDKTDIHLAEVRFDGVPSRNYAPQVMRAEMAMLGSAKMAMDAPVAAADDVDISATVSADVWLK